MPPKLPKWNQAPDFSVQYSCRSYPRQKGAKFSSIVLGPFKNLVAFRWPMVILLSWGLIFLYLYIFFVAIPPTVPITSTDGQTTDSFRAGVFAFIAWWLTNMLLIGIMLNSGSCERLKDYVADYYLESYTPSTLPDDLETMREVYKGQVDFEERPPLDRPNWLQRDLR
jgi:hypothetical protein